jgi:hypothetical protein
VLDEKAATTHISYLLNSFLTTWFIYVQLSSFRSICDANKALYGNGKRRQAFQRKKDQWVTKGPVKYLAYLLRKGITPCEGTLAHAREGGSDGDGDGGDEEQQDEEEHYYIEEDIEQEEGNESIPSDAQALIEALNSLAVGGSHAGSRAGGSRTGSRTGSRAGSRGGSRTPPRIAVMVGGASRTPPRRPAAFVPPAGGPIPMGSPSTAPRFSLQQLQSHSIQGVNMTVGQPIQAIFHGEVHTTFVGSQVAPVCLKINTTYPERNGGMIYAVEVKNVPLGPMTVNKYQVSYDGSYPDLNRFMMTIPNDSGPTNRALLRMRSAAYVHRFMSASNMACEITKRVYMEAGRNRY